MNSYFITILILGIIFPILISIIIYKACIDEIVPVALIIPGIFYWIVVLGPIGGVYYSKQYAAHKASIHSGLSSCTLYKIIEEARTSKDRWELRKSSFDGSCHCAELIDHKSNKTYHIAICSNSVLRLWDAELKVIVDKDVVVYSDNMQDGLNLHPDPVARCIMIDLIYKEFKEAVKAQEMLRYKEATANIDLFNGDTTPQPKISKKVNKDNINITVHKQKEDKRNITLDIVSHGTTQEK